MELRPVKRFSGNPNEIAVRTTVIDASGGVVAQNEGDAKDYHSFFNIQPGEYSILLEGEGIQLVEKTRIVVVAKRTTEVTAFIRRS